MSPRTPPAGSQATVSQHVAAILSHEIPANEWVVRAAERWQRDLERADLSMDWAEVDRCVEFIQGLRLVGSHAGQRWSLLPWQQWFLAAIVGWRYGDGRPRTRMALLQVARKNGKSTLMAGLALYHLIGQGKPGRVVHVIANKAEQARIVLDTARDMARPLLPDRDGKRRKTVQHNRIVCDLGTMDAVTAAEKSLDGLNPSLWIGDEVAEWRGRFVTKMTTAGVARDDACGVLITTPGNNRDLIYPELVGQCEAMLTGEVELDDWHALIYGVDESDQPEDRATWPKANPSLGAALRIETLERQWQSMSLTPMGRLEFLRFHLARPVDVVGRWLDMQHWDAVTDPAEVPDGAEVFVGVDLSKSQDMSAVVVVRGDAAGKVHFKGTYWYPEEHAKEREQVYQMPFRRWSMEGHLHLTPGREIPWEPIRAHIQQLCKTYQVRQIAVDPWAASYFTETLLADGLPVVLHQQSMRMMAPAAQTWQDLWVARRFRHGNDPVLRAACANAAVKTDDAGNLYPVKGRSRGLIDPCIAALMGVHAWALSQGTAPSMYEAGVGVG